MRAFTSLISISGGSGGSVQSTGKPGLSSNMAQTEDAGGNAEFGSEKLSAFDNSRHFHMEAFSLPPPPNRIARKRNSTLSPMPMFTAGPCRRLLSWGRAKPGCHSSGLESLTQNIWASNVKLPLSFAPFPVRIPRIELTRYTWQCILWACRVI